MFTCRAVTHRKMALAGLCLLCLQVWQSDGYYHPDEYFQTAEFASYKLGSTPVTDLAWEFPARMRPFLQPAVYYGVIRALQAVGAFSPRAALTCFHAISALLGWGALLLLWRALAPRLPDERSRTWLLAACLFTWYLPFLTVRTSSESFSGSFLAIGLAAYLLLEHRPALGAALAGLALGFSFDARYQVAFAVLGFGAWMAWTRWTRRASLLAPVGALALGFLLAAGLGLVFDRWGYGAWTFTPWN